MTNIQAIDLLKDLEQCLDDYCELNDEGKTAFRMAIEALEVFGNSEQLPSAQPERKTGKWIKNSNGTYSCDKCHSWIPNEQHYYANFCLYCGAVMIGGEECTKKI